MGGSPSPDYRKPSHRAAVNSIGAYLIASRYFEEDNTSLLRAKGLLLVALDYLGPAIAPLSIAEQKGDQLSRLLLAFTKGDKKTIEQFTEKGDRYYSLAFLLKAMAYRKAYFSAQSDEIVVEMISALPDFIFGLEYALAKGSVGGQQMAAQTYFPFLMSKQMETLALIADTKWIEKDPSIQSRMNAQPEDAKWLGDQINLLKTIYRKTTHQTSGVPIVDFDDTRERFTEELILMLTYFSNFYNKRLGSQWGGEWVVDTAELAFPDSEELTAIKLLYTIESPVQ